MLPVPTRRELEQQISRISMSADAKVLIGKILRATVEVGGKVIEVGRRVVAFVLDLLKRFRGITFGVALALTVSFLIGCTPLLGGLLSAFLAPLLVAFGLTMGALEDLRNGALYPSVEQFGEGLAETMQHG